MSGAQLKQLLEDATVVPITVEQYHRMIETGILEEGELPDGTAFDLPTDRVLP